MLCNGKAQQQLLKLKGAVFLLLITCCALLALRVPLQLTLVLSLTSSRPSVRGLLGVFTEMLGSACCGAVLLLRQSSRSCRLVVCFFGLATAGAAILQLALSPPHTLDSWDGVESWTAVARLVLGLTLATVLFWGFRQAHAQASLLAGLPKQLQADILDSADWRPLPRESSARSGPRNDVWEEWLSYASPSGSESLRSTAIASAERSSDLMHSVAVVAAEPRSEERAFASSAARPPPSTEEATSSWLPRVAMPTSTTSSHNEGHKLARSSSSVPSHSESTERVPRLPVSSLSSPSPTPTHGSDPDKPSALPSPCAVALHPDSALGRSPARPSAWTPSHDETYRASAREVIERAGEGEGGEGEGGEGEGGAIGIRSSVIGHQWVPDQSSKGVHIEFLIRSHTVLADGSLGVARLVQRRFRSFCELRDSLIRRADTRTGQGGGGKGKKARLPQLPPRGRRSLSAEFAMQRQQGLDSWLKQVTDTPEFRHCAELARFLAIEMGSSGARAGSADSEDARQELQNISTRMRLPQCALTTDSAGHFRGSALVRWLIAQALAGSREQAFDLADAMLRNGFFEAVDW
eukprot:CAMPEP_0119365758 /NCGR_PEP_ID=MMETSP1334-20130426/12662_1 /TAXON_ID=127549 /ORGANISM="Calcidiscus leptoporus, Strain RCC1130" /LENGTH=578 /DNA_ID=CAMNT_0007381805 /DNA_START=32 /DNA_END=1765 /DNA_ORIENTATION=+